MAGPTSLEGEPYVLAAAERPTLFVFVGRTCPISNSLVPEMLRIYVDYAQRGLDMFIVYTDADETLESLGQHIDEYNLDIPALLDFDQQLARELGIRVTPEAALVHTDGQLAYRGRINDLYADFGVKRNEPTSHDLRLALDALLAGKPPYPARTDAVGCYLAEASTRAD